MNAVMPGTMLVLPVCSFPVWHSRQTEPGYKESPRLFVVVYNASLLSRPVWQQCTFPAGIFIPLSDAWQQFTFFKHYTPNPPAGEFPCIVLLGDYLHWLPGTRERIHYRREEVSRSPHESPAYKNYFCLPLYMRIAFGYDGFILLFFRKIYSIPNRGRRVPLQSFLPALYNPLIRATGSHPLPFLQS